MIQRNTSSPNLPDYSSILFSSQHGTLKKLEQFFPKQHQESTSHIDAYKRYAKKILAAVTKLTEEDLTQAGLSKEERTYVQKLSSRPSLKKKATYFTKELGELQKFEDIFIQIQQITALLSKSNIFNNQHLGEVIKKNMTSKRQVQHTKALLNKMSNDLHEEAYLENIYGTFSYQEKQHVNSPSLTPITQLFGSTVQTLKELLQEHSEDLPAHLSHQALLTYNHNVIEMKKMLDHAHIQSSHLHLMEKEILTIITQENSPYTLGKYIDFYKNHPFNESFNKLETIEQTLYRSYEKTCTHIQSDIPDLQKVRYVLQYINGSHTFLQEATEVVHYLKERQEESKTLLAVLMEQHVDITLE